MSTLYAENLATAPQEEEAIELVALMGEFVDVTSAIHAAHMMRDAGFTLRRDLHSPFPIHEVEKHMGVKSTILPWLVLGGGLFGLFGGLALVWFTNAFDYPFFISGKPLFSLQANIPIIFELTILCAVLTSFFGVLGLNRLPNLYNPLFRSERFRNVTRDRFFIVVDVTDPLFNEERITKMLSDIGATAIERIED